VQRVIFLTPGRVTVAAEPHGSGGSAHITTHNSLLLLRLLVLQLVMTATAV